MYSLWAAAGVADLHAAHTVFASGTPVAGSATVCAAMLVHIGSKSLTVFITGGSRYLV